MLGVFYEVFNIRNCWTENWNACTGCNQALLESSVLLVLLLPGRVGRHSCFIPAIDNSNMHT